MRLFQEGIQVRDSTKKAGREGERTDSPGASPCSFSLLSSLPLTEPTWKLDVKESHRR